MSITKSYNKYTDTYYAYKTTYEWDEKSQRKVQKKVCIGKYDPETGEVIPNGRRGRPAKQQNHMAVPENQANIISNPVLTETTSLEISASIAEINELESAVNILEKKIKILKERMLSLRQTLTKQK